MNQISAYELDGKVCEFGDFNRVALDPSRSVVVRACAGSGKTWLLTSRIIRLLLEGIAPRQILAITFTKKAAQEMRERVGAVLAILADASDDDALSELKLRGLSHEEAQEMLPKARLLYDEVLGTGQELPIHTFHAWFHRLLQAAPMGSGIPRKVTLLEDVSELMDEAWRIFYDDLNAPEQASLLEHFLWLVRQMGEFNVHAMLTDALKKNAEITLFDEQCQLQGGDALGVLAQDLMVDTGLDVDAGEAAAYARWSDQLNDQHQLDVLIQALSCGDEKKQLRAAAFLSVFNEPDPQAQWRIFQPYLLGDGSRLRLTYFKLDAKQTQTMMASVSVEQYEAARDGINACFTQLQNDLADVRAYELNRHITPCVTALLSAYQGIKQRTGQIDFGDIERLCFQLLQRESSAAYVQVQLDARYRHLLFDEFQDTNPLQWQIINSWLAAYERDSARPKVFLVGDVKQSIYRFRKADERVFDEAQNLLVNQYQAHVLRTHATRRNSHAVVAWVNALFTPKAELFGDFSPHHTFNIDVGHIGFLGLKPEPKTDAALDEAESAPLTARNWLEEPQHILASSGRDDESALIIEAMQQLVGHYPVKDERTGRYRPARFGDIMLLVHSRRHLAGYERLLRESQIPFVSSKRGGLLATLEALDLMALLRWLMDAHDDVSLLHVLRTPIFDADESDLQRLYWQRQERKSETACSYWQVLLEMAEPSVRLQKARAMLSDWLVAAPSLPVHDVLDLIYAQGNVCMNYARRTPVWLNAQVQANLREFLQLSLSVNAGRYPSLSVFLQALQHWQKIDTEGLSEAEPIGMSDAVNILTVHASKGLESPIVMLIDMKTRATKNERANRWFIDWSPNEARPNHISWVGNQSQIGAWRTDRFALNNERAQREKLNLCYVAMTRARQLLLVSAAEVVQEVAESEADTSSGEFNRGTQNQGLYELLCEAASTLSDEYVLPQAPSDWQGLMSSWATHHQTELSSALLKTSTTSKNTWRDVALQPQKHEILNEPKETSNQESAKLGVAWHGVLEYATDHNGELLTVNEVVARFGVSHAQASDAIERALVVLQKSDWQKWFDAELYDEACNEMTVVNAAGKVSRIDRWVRAGQELTVIDYKLDLHDEALAAHQQQVAEYMSLMQALYPTCQVVGVLLSSKGASCEVLNTR